MTQSQQNPTSTPSHRKEGKTARIMRQAGLSKRGATTPDVVASRLNAIAIYMRYSAIVQGENSIDRQAEVTAAIVERLGAPVHDVYIDRARTGMTAYGRTRLNDLLHAAEAGLFNILVVENLDRIGRELYVIHMLCERLMAAGVKIYDMSGIEVRDVTLTFKALMAAAERKHMLAITYEGRKNFVRHGGIPHRVRFGYMPDIHGPKGSRVPHPLRAQAVREIFQTFDEGIGRAEIGVLMTGRYHTPRDCSLMDHGRLDPATHPFSNWTAGMIQDVLTCFLYKGILLDCQTEVQRDPVSARIVRQIGRAGTEWARAEVPGAAIVSVALFDRCFLKLAHEHRRRKAESVAKYMLTGRLLCGACGLAMSTYEQRGVRRYKCVGERGDERGTCEGVGRPTVASVEDGTLLLLERFVGDDRFGETYVAWLERHVHHLRDVAGREREALKAEHARLVEAIGTVEAQVSRYGLSAETTSPLIDGLRRERDDVGRKLALAAADAGRRPPALPSSLAEGFALMRRHLPFRGLPSGAEGEVVQPDNADPWSAETRALVRSIRDLVASATVLPDGSSTAWLRVELTIEDERTGGRVVLEHARRVEDVEGGR